MPDLQIPPNCDLTLGLVCVDKSVPGESTWEMTADERFSNPAGIIQGGFVGAICDSAMGAAAVTAALVARAEPRDADARGESEAGSRSDSRSDSRSESRPPAISVANAEMKVSFLAPVRVGSHLTCRATVASGGRRVVFVEASVTNESGALVARATSTYLISTRERN